MELTGYQLEHCRLNCRKAARSWENLYTMLVRKLNEMELLKELQNKFPSVHQHHIPKISLAGCPNGCSQPDIKDFGIVGYVTPAVSASECSGCNACVKVCLEKAITRGSEGPQIDDSRCLSCGDCLKVCSSGTLIPGVSGWILRSGGRVGRHPKFARTVGNVLTDEEAVDWIVETLQFYLKQGLPQERLTYFLERNISQGCSVNEQPGHESIDANPPGLKR